MRELRYADNSQSVSQQTGSSGWLRRKTGRVCRTRNFAARQSKNGDRILASLRARSARLSTNLGVARAARKGAENARPTERNCSRFFPEQVLRTISAHLFCIAA